MDIQYLISNVNMVDIQNSNYEMKFLKSLNIEYQSG